MSANFEKLDRLLVDWPVHSVPRRLVPQEASCHSARFLKVSGANTEQVAELMARHNDGGDLERYFERRIERLEFE